MEHYRLMLFLLLINFIGFGKNYENQETQRLLDKLIRSHDDIITQTIKFSDDIGNLDKGNKTLLHKKTKLLGDIDSEMAKCKDYFVGYDSQMSDSIFKCFSNLKNTISTEYNEAILLRVGIKFTYEQIHSFVSSHEEADKEVISFEQKLYNLEKSFATKNKLTFDKKQDDLKSNILKNEHVITYHDNLLLLFYNLYEQENRILQASSSDTNMSKRKMLIDFADAVLIAEDSIKKTKDFEGDFSFKKSIDEYIKYIKNQYFTNIDFYTEYELDIEKRKTQNKIQTQYHDRFLSEIKRAEKILKNENKEQSLHRGEVLFGVEEASYEFLYVHSPRFK
ncbi:MAG: hypothetical protein U0V72_03265 [Cytophagales bacterium]